jgi:hypothetical protein
MPHERGKLAGNRLLPGGKDDARNRIRCCHISLVFGQADGPLLWMRQKQKAKSLALARMAHEGQNAGGGTRKWLPC